MSPLARRSLASAALVLAGLTGATRRAEASPSAKLVYVRGASAERCPGEPELRRAVAARLGYDPFFAAANKTVIADVVRTDVGFRAKVRIVRDDGVVRGERELATSGEDCGELVSALALAISIALDDLDEFAPAPVTATPEETPSEPPPPPPQELPPPPAERPRPSRPEADRPSLRLSLGPALSTGTAPALATGAGVAADLRLRAVSLRLDARAELPASDSFVLPAGTSGRLSTSLLVATAAGCAHLGIAFACAGGGIGRLASETTDLGRNAADAAPFGVLLGRLGIEVDLGRTFFLSPFLDAAVPLARHRVGVAETTVFRMAPVAGTLALHLGARVF